MPIVFRVRPANEKTIEEIINSYLWFSRPENYRDTEDANIFAFSEANESLKTAFARLFKSHTYVATESALAGICCFTEEMPSTADLRRFPNTADGLVIGYNREILGAHFVQQKSLGDCFKRVEYIEKPTLFKSTNKEDILWEKSGEDEIYTPMTLITSDEKLMDQLFLKMFTLIAVRFMRQKELRIILAGRDIPDRADVLKGYKIPVPEETIKHIYVHAKAPDDIKDSVAKSGFEFSLI